MGKDLPPPCLSVIHHLEAEAQLQLPKMPSPAPGEQGRAQHLCHHGTKATPLPQLSQAGDLIIEVYLEQKLPDCCVTLKVSPRGWPCQGGVAGRGLLAQPVPGSHPATAHRSSPPCVRPQVSPTMTAEELTNQVLEMRNVATSLDIWLTFEVLENGELGEHCGAGDAWGKVCYQEQGGRWLEKGRDTMVTVFLSPQSGPCTPRRRCWSRRCSGASSRSPALHTCW